MKNFKMIFGLALMVLILVFISKQIIVPDSKETEITKLVSFINRAIVFFVFTFLTLKTLGKKIIN